MRYRMRSCTGADRVGRLLLTAALLYFGSWAEARTRNYAPFPRPDAGYVTDTVGLLTREQEQQLERQLLLTEQRSGVEIIVVTIRSTRDYPGTPNRNIEEFARALFDTYGVGNMPKKNGVLLLVVTQDRKAKIMLGAGYGHARDKDADRIMGRKIVPYFREGKYAEGVTSGVEALIREFGSTASVPRWLFWAIAGAMVLLIPVAISLFRNGKRSWGWVVLGLILVLLLALIWLGRRAVETASEGGGEPGGLGGFGGGFSGGGGATGSW
jgi:uncharacterized protein